MKLFILYSLVVVFLAHVANAWELQEYIPAIFSRPSRIPQFILDARHPWIQENKNALERLPDPKHAVCSLDSSLRFPNSSSPLTYPSDLFRYLEIDNNRGGVDRAGWSNAVSRLKEMTDCPAALQDVEAFKVEIFAVGGGIPSRGDQNLRSHLLNCLVFSLMY